MPVDITEKTSGLTISAREIRDNVEAIQEFVNGGIRNADLERSSLETENILKPEFYGSPSPRVEGVSSDTYYRSRSNNKLDRYYRHEQTGYTNKSADYPPPFSAYQPIEGMSCSVFCDEAPIAVTVTGSFYAFESGGFSGQYEHKISSNHKFPWYWAEYRETSAKSGFEKSRTQSYVCAEFMLFLDRMDGEDPQPIGATRRYLHPRARGAYNCNRIQSSFHVVLSPSYFGLTIGVNKISYRCRYRLISEDNKTSRHVYVDGRNLVVDALYR
jgi:hypothetical protein